MDGPKPTLVLAVTVIRYSEFGNKDETVTDRDDVSITVTALLESVTTTL